MHTIAKNQHHNTRLIDDFIHIAYPKGQPSIRDLINDNIINGTQILELAVSKTGGIPMCPVGNNRDLIDDSDVKTATVIKSVSIKRATLKGGKKKKYTSTTYKFQIKRVNVKFGVLRVICWNPFADTYQFFKIPPSAFMGLGSLVVSFDKNKNFKSTGKYAKYEVPSFSQMAAPLTLEEKLDTIMCNVALNSVTDQIEKVMELFSNNKGKTPIRL